MTIRAFDGSLEDARGLLVVERATFDECPYTARQVQAMLSRGRQHAWVALDDEEVAGFAIAFAVNSLQGTWWEIDLLAVHPECEGRGLGRQLIRAACTGSPAGTCEAKAVVASENERSARAFARAGFSPDPAASSLLIYRLDTPPPDLNPVPGLVVRRAASIAEAARWLAGQPAPPASGRNPILLLAEQNGRPAGYAELVDVQTLLYRGTWIQSLAAPSRTAREALVSYALNRAENAGYDEVSAVVPQQNHLVEHTLSSLGFRTIGLYRWLSASLPLRSQPGAKVE